MHDLGKDAIITLSAGSVRCCLKGTDESFKVFSSLTVVRRASCFPHKGPSRRAFLFLRD